MCKQQSWLNVQELLDDEDGSKRGRNEEELVRGAEDQDGAN